MDFSFRPYRTTEKHVLSQVRTLMEEAFPPSERRAWKDFEQLLSSEPRFTLFLLYREDSLLGFFTLWDLDFFFYGEHFALFPSRRGSGMGQVFLEKICAYARERQKPLVLEVERPEDELTRRRLEFYLRNSFSLLSREYIQPSYALNSPEVPMYLLGTLPADEASISTYVLCIKQAVYTRF